MTWTVTPTDSEGTLDSKPIAIRLHVRAIINVDTEQHELKALIESLQKHVKEST